MKSLFPHYYKISGAELSKLWSESLIVLDTNVLLDLYRVKSGTRDEILKLLEELSDRIWVPFQVVLEFHANRLSVIDEQHKLFSRIEKSASEGVENLFKSLDEYNVEKRHASIDIESFKESVKNSLTNFESEMKKLEMEHLSVNSPVDPILEKLEGLLNGRVGPAPGSQEYIDKLEKEFKDGFSKKIIPGYKDSSKEGISKYKNLVMSRKYGDAYVWNQTKVYLSNSEFKSLIFVTNDTKEDWLRRVGGKTISAQPNILDDMYTSTNVDAFNIYTLQSFLHSAQEHLDRGVSQDAVSDVADISRPNLKRVDIEEMAAKYMRNTLDNNEEPALSEFASDIGWSPQSIRRRLEVLNSSWQKIKADQKIGRVLDAMQSGERGIDKLLELSCYSEPGAFYRAFKAETGFTPGEIIKALDDIEDD